MIKLYVLSLIISMLWGYWLAGLTSDLVSLGAGDFEVYKLGVVIICLINCIAAKLISMKGDRPLVSAYAILYLMAGLIQLFSLTDTEAAYVISDSFFSILIPISITLVVLDARRKAWRGVL